jgi:hypothetical protein
VFVSAVVQNLCRTFARVETKRKFTSPYVPQTEGMVDRFSATLCRDLAMFVTHEGDWDRHLAFDVFRYNASSNEATGVSPFRAFFGVDPFEVDACLGLEFRLEDEPHDVAQRRAAEHGQLYKKAMRSRAAAQVQYDKAVKTCSNAVGDRILIYHTPGETVSGRKLRVPWVGPYRIGERHSAVGYSAVSELEGKTARVYVNRLKAVPDGREVDASAPEQGLWTYVRRVLRRVLSKRTVRDVVEYQVRKVGRNGFVWVGAEDLPDVDVKAYEMSRG